MRIEQETPEVPSKFTLTYSENGAHVLTQRISQGLQFRCIRYANQVSDTDCTKAVRTLCRECATGHAIRRKAGLTEPSWFAPIDIQPKEDLSKMKSGIKKCEGCGKDKRIKARGLCSVCYNRSNRRGELPPKKEKLVKVDNFEAIPVMDVGPPAKPVEHDMGGGKTELTIDLNVVVDQGFAEPDEVLQVMADFAGMARKQVRTPEAEVFALMRCAVRMKEIQKAA